MLPALFVGALFYILLTRQPAPQLEAWAFNGLTMGTTYTVKVIVPRGAEGKRAAADAIRGALEAVNARMSTYKPDSELSKLNRAPAGRSKASAELIALLGDARSISVASGGAFDVTVGPLVNAWGFGPEKDQAPPDQAQIDALRARVGYDKLALHPEVGEIERARADLYVDLSAIAKGHGVDRVAEALTGLGYDRFMVEVGGEIQTRGHNLEGQPWRVGVQRPVPGGAPAVEEILSLSGVGMATSGDYRNYREIDGVRISHTIDARTGRPITHTLASVSVIHPRCALADGWATALNVLGPEEGYRVAVERDLAALLLIREGDTFIQRATPRFERYRLEPAEAKDKAL